MSRIELKKDNIEAIKDCYLINEDKTEVVDRILSAKNDIEELLNKCNKSIEDYEGALIFSTFGRIVDENRWFNSFCVSIEIENGKYFIEGIYGFKKWRSLRKLEVFIPKKPIVGVELDYFMYDYKCNSVMIRGDYVTFNLKRGRLIFDYKLDSYDGFVDVVDHYLKHIPNWKVKEVKESALEYIETFYPELL